MYNHPQIYSQIILKIKIVFICFPLYPIKSLPSQTSPEIITSRMKTHSNKKGKKITVFTTPKKRKEILHQSRKCKKLLLCSTSTTNFALSNIGKWERREREEKHFPFISFRTYQKLIKRKTSIVLNFDLPTKFERYLIVTQFRKLLNREEIRRKRQTINTKISEKRKKHTAQ